MVRLSKANKLLTTGPPRVMNALLINNVFIWIIIWETDRVDLLAITGPLRQLETLFVAVFPTF